MSLSSRLGVGRLRRLTGRVITGRALEIKPRTSDLNNRNHLAPPQHTHTQHVLLCAELNAHFLTYLNFFSPAFHRFIMSSPWHKLHCDGKKRHVRPQAVLPNSAKHKYQVCSSHTVRHVLSHQLSNHKHVGYIWFVWFHLESARCTRILLNRVNQFSKALSRFDATYLYTNLYFDQYKRVPLWKSNTNLYEIVKTISAPTGINSLSNKSQAWETDRGFFMLQFLNAV